MRIGLLVTVVAVFAACAADPGPPDTRIAFNSMRDGNWEVYVTSPDGSDQARLTSNAIDDLALGWSHDGRDLAVRTYRGEHQEIYVVDLDRGSLVNHYFIEEMSLDEGHAWTRDGKEFAYHALRGGAAARARESLNANYEIFLYRDFSRLTYNESDDKFPSWSPDGTRLTFISDRDGNYEIYVMNADGSDQDRITNNTAADMDPEWSPDGGRIAFVSDRDGNEEIYLMNSDGSDQMRLTNNGATDYDPAWSPDGEKIAFTSNRDGNDEIYTMDSDGSHQTRLTHHPASDVHPIWSVGTVPVSGEATGPVAIPLQ